MDAFQQPPPPTNTQNTLPKRKPIISDSPDGHPTSNAAPPNTSSPLRDLNMGGGGNEPAVGSQDGDSTKRKSIDLLEQLTRAAPLTHQTMAPVEPQMPAPMMNYASPAQQPQQMGGYRPQPQVPTMDSMMPREQSPALMGQTPPSTSPGYGMSGPVMANQMQNMGQSRASPTSKGGRAGGNNAKKDWKSKSGANEFLKSRSPAGPQSFTLDLSLPLAATSASSERLHITPIALLKLESIYVPGCTIGVSHWIAYAMTKGAFILFNRVELIF